jgi:hypothetical protein
VPRLPKQMHWIFWDVDARCIHVDKHATSIIPRVLERGRLVDVQWLLKTYGRRAIHAFLRDVGHIELTSRTLTFWRAAFHAKDETWVNPRALRPLSSAPWID